MGPSTSQKNTLNWSKWLLE